MTTVDNHRENWGSRAGFVLAAVGSAVGLGNVWRFPHECYSHGGSAFLIPYILAMIVIGIPLLIMEFSLGHLTQRAAPEAFKHVGRKWEFVGWWPILLSFAIVTYYAVVLAWCLSYLIRSFGAELPWTGGHAETYFTDVYLQQIKDNANMQLGSLRWPIVGALAGMWLLMYLCIFKGVKLVSKIVLWTVPLPIFMLAILLIRGLTLDGAIQGLEYYLEPDWDMLKDPEVWRAAFGQVFFTLSLAFGVMITYASFLHRRSDLNNNAVIIALSDLATSFIAGIAVFATMGSLALKTGTPVEEVLQGSESLGLAFVAFPEALGHLPWAHFFSVLFFMALILLGIDSAFSITEATLASLVDKTSWKRGAVLLAMSVVGFGIGLIFTTQGGLSWLGFVNDAVNGIYGIMLVGLVECLVLGWVFDIGKLRRHANHHSDWKIGVWWEWAIRLVIPVILGGLIAWSIVDLVKGPTLKPGEITHLSEFIDTIREADTPLGMHIRDHVLAGELQSQAEAAATDDSKFQKRFSGGLNKMIKENGLYAEDRFAGVNLSEDTQYLIAHRTEQKNPSYLNRWLLHDAYPDYIPASKNVGYLRDFKGQWIKMDVMGLGMMAAFFLAAIVLSIWNPKKNDADGQAVPRSGNVSIG